MENANLWLFTKELANTPNRKRIDEVKESSCRKMGFDFVKEIRGSLKAYPFWFKYVLQDGTYVSNAAGYKTFYMSPMRCACVTRDPLALVSISPMIWNSHCDEVFTLNVPIFSVEICKTSHSAITSKFLIAALEQLR
ncbi:hypothetical protein TNCV_4809291 [Trichonephila clavipes]|nr:hypothetical protein TNCV_4809291 [Trichonephila clavipes]